MTDKVLTVLIAWIVWALLGCVVLAFVDDDRHSLFNWAIKCPVPLGYELVLTLWPFVVIAWIRNRYFKR